MKTKFYLLTIHIETNSGEFFTGERYSYLDQTKNFECAFGDAFDVINETFKKEMQMMAESIRLNVFKSVVFSLYNPYEELLNEMKIESHGKR